MDLRTFTSERKGCLFELDALINVVPLHRMILLTDETTDQPLLQRTLADLWQRVSPQSPNACSGVARLRMIDLTCGYPSAVRRLIQLGDQLSPASA
jgi:hypothetical protein